MVDDVTEFLSARHSVRDFLPDPVPDSLVTQIIQDGLSAPSWSNTRPYRVAVATGHTRDAISGELMKHFNAFRRFNEGNLWQKVAAVAGGKVFPASDFRVPLKNPADVQPRRVALAKKLFGQLGIERADIVGRNTEIGRNFEFFGAPVALFVFARSRMGVYSPLDAGFFAQNLLLSAAHRGLGACAQGFLAVWSAPVKKHFSIPRGYKLLFGVSLGYPSTAPINDFLPPETGAQEIILRPQTKDTA
jgi:nitroreductase